MSRTMTRYRNRIKSARLAAQLHCENVLGRDFSSDELFQGKSKNGFYAHEIHLMIADLLLLYDAEVVRPTENPLAMAQDIYLSARQQLGTELLRQLNEEKEN